MIPSKRRRQLAFGLLLAQLGGSLLLLSCVARFLVWVLPRKAAVQVGRSTISLIYRGCWATAQRLGLMRIDADALDALRGERGGLILAANHPTMIDAMLVVAHLPNSVCVMRADLMRSVFLGPGARLANYIGSRDGGSVVRESVAALREGQTVVFFPEGTRTSKPPVDAFKPGLTFIAKLARVPIQTVLIRCESPYLRKGWPLLRIPPRVVRFHVTLGRRFQGIEDSRGALRQIEEYFAEALSPPGAVPPASQRSSGEREETIAPISTAREDVELPPQGRHRLARPEAPGRARRWPADA